MIWLVLGAGCLVIHLFLVTIPTFCLAILDNQMANSVQRSYKHDTKSYKTSSRKVSRVSHDTIDRLAHPLYCRYVILRHPPQTPKHHYSSILLETALPFSASLEDSDVLVIFSGDGVDGPPPKLPNPVVTTLERSFSAKSYAPLVKASITESNSCFGLKLLVHKARKKFLSSLAKAMHFSSPSSPRLYIPSRIMSLNVEVVADLL